MVHNGIEYGDMQLISEVYDVLKVRFDTICVVQYDRFWPLISCFPERSWHEQ